MTITQNGPVTFEKVTLTKPSEIPGYVDESATFALVDDWQRNKVAECIADGWTVSRRWLATPSTRTVVELEVPAK